VQCPQLPTRGEDAAIPPAAPTPSALPSAKPPIDLDKFLHASESRQLTLVKVLDAAGAQNLRVAITGYAQKTRIFERLMELQDGGATVEDSYRAVTGEFGITAEELRAVEDEGLEKDWPPLGNTAVFDVPCLVIERLLAREDPEQNVAARQDSEFREASTREALEKIKEETRRYASETKEEAEARHAAADAEARRLNNAAAKLIKPLSSIPADQLVVQLSSRSKDELDRLLSAVRRCIDAIEERNTEDDPAPTAPLKALEKRICRALADFR